MFFNLIGSLGLFLLGMWLMTEGLKLAGGNRLGDLLGQWTSNRKRGLASGILITGLVQSSSAVTVATIGFVNAGLLKFQQAIWVIFGCNVGTTFTAWVVTLLGFSLKIEAASLPIIGLGAALRIFAPSERGKAFGTALSGFGLLFMGIGALQENFSVYADEINVEAILLNTPHKTLLALGIGFILTLLTQSSSAAIVIILTAVASNVIGVNSAAAAVIGANVGTTSTALLACIGATANAKRLAWAHVIFNVLTAAVALLILPIFWVITSRISAAVGVEGNLTMMLAVFHTCFNILGVLLMWPLEPQLSKRLLSLYKSPTDRLQTSGFLDANTITVPELAIRAMTLELEQLQDKASRLTLPGDNVNPISMKDISVFRSQVENVSAFIAQCLKSELTKDQGAQFAQGLSVVHHLTYACTTFEQTYDHYLAIRNSSYAIPDKLGDWFSSVNAFNQTNATSSIESMHEQLVILSENYKSVKTRMLSAAVSERLNIETVDEALQAASLARRLVEQISQARIAYKSLAQLVFSKNVAHVISESTESTVTASPAENPSMT